MASKFIGNHQGDGTGLTGVVKTAGDTMTGSLTMGSGYASLVTNVSGSFTVGGVSTSYYPVRFQMTGPGPSTNTRLILFRPSVHTNSSWAGTFHFEVDIHPTNWGHFSKQISYIRYITGGGSPYNDPIGEIADGSTASGSSDITVWLKGGATYFWKSPDLVNGWRLLDGNSGGTTLTSSSGTTLNILTAQSSTILNSKDRFMVYNGGFGAGTSLQVGGTTGANVTWSGTNLAVDKQMSVDGGTTLAAVFKSQSDAQIQLNGSSTSWAGIQWVDNAGGDFMWYNGSTSTFALGGGGSAVTGKKLHVDGGLSVGVNSDTVAMPANGIYSEGAITSASDITAFSDERLKSDIVTIEGALDKVSQLRGVDYIKDGKPSTGVIAQEVEAVKPELVHTAGDEMGTKSVAYGNMAGLFIEAIKELKDEVAALKAEIAELKK